MDILLKISGSLDVDSTSRRVVGDLLQSDLIEDAGIAKHPAKVGEKGIIEEMGTIVVSMLNPAGVSAIFEVLRPLLSIGRKQSDDQRTIVFETSKGTRLELSGGMNDSEFLLTRDKLFSLLESEVNGEAT